MTIEEIKKASDELFKSFRCGKTYRMGFETGVMWSDEHLQVPKIISKTMKITREEAKELLPIIQAFAEGKQIEVKRKNEWFGIGDELYLSESPSDYRIKPEPKYRPFKTQEECWEEMLKHQPFGYIKRKENNEITQITGMNTVHYEELHIDLSFNSNSFYTADNLFDVYTFTDGTPFGIKEE